MHVRHATTKATCPPTHYWIHRDVQHCLYAGTQTHMSTSVNGRTFASSLMASAYNPPLRHHRSNTNNNTITHTNTFTHPPNAKSAPHTTLYRHITYTIFHISANPRHRHRFAMQIPMRMRCVTATLSRSHPLLALAGANMYLRFT